MADLVWCIAHPDGPIPETASRNPFAPVALVCEALDADWDDLKEQGYRLVQVNMADESPAPNGGDAPSLRHPQP